MLFKASAPGSLMLLGEYAVLSGKPALVCAVDKRLSVTLEPLASNQITIDSQRFGHFSTEISRLAIKAPYSFVTAALASYQKKLTTGCRIVIETEFSDKIGLGSSAAVTVATLAAISSWLGEPLSPIDLAQKGRKLVRKVQGVGSGADIAASVFGGMVAYCAAPLIAEKLGPTHPITLIYTGYKTPTKIAVQKVQEYFKDRPALFRHICNAIGACAAAGIEAVKNEDWIAMAKIMNIQQGLMSALGVATPEIDSIIKAMQKASITGAKISGSGLGDCVVGWGKKDVQMSAPFLAIPVAMTDEGVQCEEVGCRTFYSG